MQECPQACWYPSKATLSSVLHGARDVSWPLAGRPVECDISSNATKGLPVLHTPARIPILPLSGLFITVLTGRHSSQPRPGHLPHPSCQAQQGGHRNGWLPSGPQSITVWSVLPLFIFKVSDSSYFMEEGGHKQQCLCSGHTMVVLGELYAVPGLKSVLVGCI